MSKNGHSNEVEAINRELILKELQLDADTDSFPLLARHLLASAAASQSFATSIINHWKLVMPSTQPNHAKSLFSQMAESLLCSASLMEFPCADLNLTMTQLALAMDVSRETTLDWESADRELHKVSIINQSAEGSLSLPPPYSLESLVASGILIDNAIWVPSTESVEGRYWLEERRVQKEGTKRERLLLKQTGKERPLRRYEVSLPCLTAVMMHWRARLESIAPTLLLSPHITNEKAAISPPKAEVSSGLMLCPHVGCNWSTQKGERGLKIHMTKMHGGALASAANAPSEAASHSSASSKQAIQWSPAVCSVSSLLRCPTTGEEFERRVALREYWLALAHNARNGLSPEVVHVIESSTRETYSILVDALRWYLAKKKEATTLLGPALTDFLASDFLAAALSVAKEKTTLWDAADTLVHCLNHPGATVIILNAYKAPSWDLCVLRAVVAPTAQGQQPQTSTNGSYSYHLSIRYIQCKYYPNSPFKPDYRAEAMKIDQQLLKAAADTNANSVAQIQTLCDCQLASSELPSWGNELAPSMVHVAIEMLTVLPSSSSAKLNCFVAAQSGSAANTKASAKAKLKDAAILHEDYIKETNTVTIHDGVTQVSLATEVTTCQAVAVPLDSHTKQLSISSLVPPYVIFEYPAGSEHLSRYWHPLPMLEGSA